MRTSNLTVLTVSLVVLAACATDPSGRSYPRSETRTAYDISFGEVVDVRIVTIEGNPGIIGTWGGASVGRAVGAVSSDRRRTRILGSAAGGIAGAVAGRAIERKIREEEALEITVQLDDAEAIAIVQADDVAFEPGDRVRVLFGRDGSARVTTL